MGRHRYRSLREYLKKTGTKQEDFAAKFGISQGQLSKIATGKQQPRLDLAIEIAKAADIPVASLIASDEAMAS